MPAQEREAFFNGSPADRAKHSSAAPADSAPATPVDQAASTDASPPAASEPATPAKKKGLEARSADVDLQIADLKRTLEIKQELERQLSARETPKQDAKTDPSPAATKADWERLMEHPDAPNLDTIGDYDKWVAAMSVFTTSQLLKEARAAESATAQQRQEQHAYTERLTAANDRVKAYREKNPNAQPDETLAAIVPVSQLPAGAPIGPHNFVMEQVIDSEVPGELLMHFTAHPEVFRELLTLDPQSIVRRIGRLEASLLGTEPSPERDHPSPKVIPDITDVPTTLGRRSPVTADDGETAMKNGDFLAYERAFLKRIGASA